MAVLFYAPPSSIWEFQFLPIFTNTCYLSSLFLPSWRESGVILWFRSAFPWWLMILSICACVYWLYVYSLWRNVYSHLLPIMSWVVFLLLSCIFCIVAPHRMHDLQIFCRLQWVVVSQSRSPLKHKVLDFDEVQFTCFFLEVFVLLVPYLTNHCVIWGLEDLWLFGPKSFIVLALDILGVFSSVICGT